MAILFTRVFDQPVALHPSRGTPKKKRLASFFYTSSSLGAMNGMDKQGRLALAAGCAIHTTLYCVSKRHQLPKPTIECHKHHINGHENNNDPNGSGSFPTHSHAQPMDVSHGRFCFRHKIN
jgi:hypothetical protein